LLALVAFVGAGVLRGRYVFVVAGVLWGWLVLLALVFVGIAGFVGAGGFCG
jgi:hypothetical protein